jgi:hypothetical protein
MDIMTAISAATKSLELVRKDLNRQISEADLKARAAELLSSLADVKVALVEARDDIAAKDAAQRHRRRLAGDQAGSWRRR